MANPRTLDRATLILVARTTASAIAGGKVKGFTPEQNATISDALVAEADLLHEENKDAATFLTDYRSKLEAARERQARIVSMLTDSKYAMRAVNASDSEYEAVGFEPPAKTGSRVTPKTPTKLSATGFSNGVNRLRFTSHNVSGRVVFNIQANDGTGWVMIGSTRKQSFTHSGVVPGQPYKYRVRAEATRGQVSTWSNTGSVYEQKSKKDTGPVSEGE